MDESTRGFSDKEMVGGRLWAGRADIVATMTMCGVLEDGRPCAGEAFVRIWRSQNPDDVTNCCLKHAQQEEPIFLVEPIFRKDFHSPEYELLLEKSVVGQQLGPRRLTHVTCVPEKQDLVSV